MQQKLIIIFFILLSNTILAQTASSIKTTDSVLRHNNKEKDLSDFLHHVFHKQSTADSVKPPEKKYYISVVPAFGYSLQTGWAGILSGNIAFKMGNAPNQKVSSITTSITYSQYNQTIVPFIANIWTKNNKLNFTTDIRYIQYPSDVFGIGGRTDPNQGYTINFTGFKFHQSVQKEIANNLYVGLGYYYDYCWNIKALDSLRKNIARRLSNKLGTSELASGIAFKVLYDSRLNQINPQQGIFANVVYRSNHTFLGSNENWESLLTDVRAYLPFPKRSKNILAVWAYSWLTVGSTTPPYLMLPSVGWDDSYNTGRGYIQGRFRGKNMYYFETEYRARLSRNGMFGGVLFCNLEKFSGDLSQTYTTVKPGYGLGLRMKLNKTSGANICLDYGFGNNGSKGFFVNIGEVF
jgi:outer membrane protein assembly factor BamA